MYSIIPSAEKIADGAFALVIVIIILYIWSNYCLPGNEGSLPAQASTTIQERHSAVDVPDVPGRWSGKQDDRIGAVRKAEQQHQH